MDQEIRQFMDECRRMAESMPRVTGLVLGIAAQPLVEALWKAFRLFMTN
jgi:hypothetical protein